jgi:hypothetical protein
MKFAIIKLGARISFNSNDTSGGNGEARSIIKMLQRGGAEVHVFTKILSRDTLVEDIHWHDLQKEVDDTMAALDKMDALIVINGHVNFFGGAEDREQLINYVIINSFKGRVFYFLCDPELTLKQVWPAVERKPWAVNWNQESIFISRDDIICFSQPYDVSKVLTALGRNEVVPAKIDHFPFEKFPCLHSRLSLNATPSVDISYGGTMRGGKRAEKMVKYYFGYPDDLTVEMFGKIELQDFLQHKKVAQEAQSLRPPSFTGPVRYDQMLPKMNQALAHCVIGDPWYEQINDMAQRAYESIWSSVVTFIDSDLDQLRRVYGGDKELADFLYVSSRQHLIERLRIVKRDSELRKEIVQAQFDVVNFDEHTYCSGLVSLMGHYL